MASNRTRLVALLGLALVAWLGIEWYGSRQPTSGDFHDDIARATGDLPEAPAPLTRTGAGAIRLAVGPLGLAGPATQGAGAGVDDAVVADLLTAEMSAAEGFELVERREMTRILKEFELSTLGGIQPADAIRLGRLVKAEWFLLGARHVSGTNASTLVRIVDAGNGILRDLTVLPENQSPDAIAKALAVFVRRTRDGAVAAAGGPVFAAVGGFEDLSLRPRHAGVEAELRAHLNSALARRGVVLLERELTRLLLDEIRLATEGLIEATAVPPRMQSSVWLVDGFYQSFDTTGDEIEMTVRVSRVGGGVWRKNVRGERGSTLLSAVDNAVATLLETTAPLPVPSTRRGEIRAQLALGLERSRFVESDLDGGRWQIEFMRRRQDDEETAGRRRTNLLAAIQSFESALLLDPARTDAKLYLARCLVDPHLGQPEDARNLWRELSHVTNGFVSRSASIAIGFSYVAYGEPARGVEWFQRLTTTTTNEALRRTYSNCVAQAENALAHSQDGRVLLTREKREAALRQQAMSWLKNSREGRSNSENGALTPFLHNHPEGDEGALAHLADFFQRLAAEIPELEPYLWARALPRFEKTNNPVVGRFEASLAAVSAHPRQVLRPDQFFNQLDACFRWAFDNRLPSLALRIAQAERAARDAGVRLESGDWSRIEMGFAFALQRQWREAIAEFTAITNRVVRVSYPGPWGGFPSVVVPSAFARNCRKYLGETEPADPRRFEVGTPVMVFESDFAFLPDKTRIWVALGGNIIERDANSTSAVTNSLGFIPDIEPAAMAQSPETLWIGAKGTGLFAFDKRTRRTRRFRTVDGLLFDDVRALYFDGAAVWIGCENDKVGGICRLDPATDTIRAFAPKLPTGALTKNLDDPAGAPRRPVRAIARDSGGDMWVGTYRGRWQRYRPSNDTWSTPFEPNRNPAVATIAATARWVVMGENPSPPQQDDLRLLAILSLDSSNPLRLGPADGLPYTCVSAVAIDGERLWVGGPGYLAVMDLKSKQILRECLVSHMSVTQIAIDGDDVWARLNSGIFRFPRAL